MPPGLVVVLAVFYIFKPLFVLFQFYDDVVCLIFFIMNCLEHCVDYGKAGCKCDKINNK